MEVAASYHNIQHFHERCAVYTCCVYKKDLSVVNKFCGQHLAEFSDDDVRGVALSHCNIPSFPRELASVFPNLDHMAINGGLSEISKQDFAGYRNLRFLDLQGCEITSLPSNLFENLPNLEVVYLSRNKISVVDEDFFEPLRALKYIDFRGNLMKTENAVYDQDRAEELSFDEFKNAITERC